MYDRRRVLRYGGLVLSGSLAGCSFGSRSPPDARIAWISLVNDSDESREVRVTVSAEGVTEFFETYRLGTSHETAAALVETPVSGAGQYDVQATTTGQIAALSAPEWTDGDERCVGVEFLIATDGTLHWDTKSMQEC